MRRYFLLLMLASLLTVFQTASAELVVVVSAGSGIEKLSRDEVVDLFMGRTRKLPNGALAITVDLSNANPEKAMFYQQLIGRELAEVNSYWARLRFSGQGMPPIQAENSDELIRLIADNKSAIGYIERKKLDRRLKPVYILSQATP
ncbi:hypothetical protein [Undibacterium luofuense]|uniref:Phosphate ABC transporter substrate-binding protein n=1 Tax=Undibacterium luofuense TaxID=2828733 RepID=A0A941I7K8_9BURK|nr:hypothetical protein [Undibacterium luofuense]MBR7781943.1 hypothetical protein [Undibacterium luofuense]